MALSNVPSGRLLIGIAISIACIGGFTVPFLVEMQNTVRMDPIPFRTIAWGHGGSAGYEQPVNIVIDNQTEWIRVWGEFSGCGTAYASLDGCPVPPYVDFNQTVVIATFAGVYYQTDHLINITRIEQGNGIVYAHITLTASGPSCLTAAATSHPFHIVAIRRTSSKISFTEETSLHVC